MREMCHFSKKPNSFSLPLKPSSLRFKQQQTRLREEDVWETFYTSSASFQSSIWRITNRYFKPFLDVPFFLKCPCHPLKTTNPSRPSMFSSLHFRIAILLNNCCCITNSLHIPVASSNRHLFFTPKFLVGWGGSALYVSHPYPGARGDSAQVNHTSISQVSTSTMSASIPLTKASPMAKPNVKGQGHVIHLCERNCRVTWHGAWI